MILDLIIRLNLNIDDFGSVYSAVSLFAFLKHFVASRMCDAHDEPRGADMFEIKKWTVNGN